MKSILFNTEMVSAILDGRKTETRRVIKPQPNGDWATIINEIAPYQQGDVLYVRETFCIGKINSGEEPDGREAIYVSQCDGEEDYIPKEYVIRNGIGTDDVVWKPSVQMPKEAARIFLRVTDVRVERLQDMPHDVPAKEGIHYCECSDGFTWKAHTAMQDCYINPMGAIKALWDSTIKKSDLERYGWNANPWVWVIEFERITKEEAMKEKSQ